MGAIRYLGSKARLTNQLQGILGTPRRGNSSRFVDFFSGTGAVSLAASEAGWQVSANDHLLSATIMTAARLMTRAQAKFTSFGGYQQAIENLNELRPKKGFFYREYCPEGHNEAGVQRKYFTSDNAKRIDAVRCQIREWNAAGDLSKLEHWLLLADLIASTNQVANIAGTYGCFMNSFTPTALRPLQMRPRLLRRTSPDWTVTNSDVFDLEPGQGDVPYLDPPYTKRQYAAYYHIPETIAAEDEPKVSGITGLRPWKAKSSAFCYKVK